MAMAEAPGSYVQRYYRCHLSYDQHLNFCPPSEIKILWLFFLILLYFSSCGSR